MKRQILTLLGLFLVAGLLMGPASEAPAGHELVGSPKCKMCHKAKTGDQWKIWSESAHAGAFTTLASDEAKKIAAEMGLGDPQTEDACVKCHASHAFLGREVVVNAKGKYADAEGVGCEACHGPGSDYKSKKIMMDPAAAKAAGLVKDASEAFCVQCHNAESPTFQGFDFAACWPEIAHPVPEKK